MTDDNKVVKLRVIDNTDEQLADEELLKKQQAELVDKLVEDGPFEWIVGVARRMDGTMINFGSTMEIRDLLLAANLMDIISKETLKEMLAQGDA